MSFQDLKHQRHHFSIHWQNQKSPSKMKNNVLLSGCTNDSLKSLQLILTHTLTRTKQYEHVSPVLASQHWCPVKSRIDVKVLCLSSKWRNELSPVKTVLRLFPENLCYLSWVFFPDCVFLVRVYFEFFALTFWILLSDSSKDFLL